jgi:hypothetical protein
VENELDKYPNYDCSKYVQNFEKSYHYAEDVFAAYQANTKISEKLNDDICEAVYLSLSLDPEIFTVRYRRGTVNISPIWKNEANKNHFNNSLIELHDHNDYLSYREDFTFDKTDWRFTLNAYNKEYNDTNIGGFTEFIKVMSAFAESFSKEGFDIINLYKDIHELQAAYNIERAKPEYSVDAIISKVKKTISVYTDYLDEVMFGTNLRGYIQGIYHRSKYFRSREVFFSPIFLERKKNTVHIMFVPDSMSEGWEPISRNLKKDDFNNQMSNNVYQQVKYAIDEKIATFYAKAKEEPDAQ